MNKNANFGQKILIFTGEIKSFVSSVRSSNSHPDLLLIQHPTHFFRSHQSSTLDLHFLSHYSYIKAIMLYKGTTWQDSGILWNTLATMTTLSTMITMTTMT